MVVRISVLRVFSQNTEILFPKHLQMHLSVLPPSPTGTIMIIPLTATSRSNFGHRPIIIIIIVVNVVVNMFELVGRCCCASSLQMVTVHLAATVQAGTVKCGARWAMPYEMLHNSEQRMRLEAIIARMTAVGLLRSKTLTEMNMGRIDGGLAADSTAVAARYWIGCCGGWRNDGGWSRRDHYRCRWGDPGAVNVCSAMCRSWRRRRRWVVIGVAVAAACGSGTRRSGRRRGIGRAVGADGHRRMITDCISVLVSVIKLQFYWILDWWHLREICFTST